MTEALPTTSLSAPAADHQQQIYYRIHDAETLAAFDAFRRLFSAFLPTDEKGDPLKVRLEAILPAIRGIAAVTAPVIAERTGDRHGSCYEFSGLENVIYRVTPEGALAAFALHVALPTIGTFWHGAYGRDFKFVRSWSDFNAVVGQANKFAGSDEDFRCLKAHALGPLFCAGADGMELKWLSYNPEGEVSFRGVRVSAAGKVAEQFHKIVIAPSSRVFY